MPKFFIYESEICSGESIFLRDENLKHINVLRYKVGDEIVVCTGDGIDIKCEINNFSKDKVELKILEKMESESESKFKIYLFQGLPKNDKMEFIIQKAVELGVYEIIPVITEFCQVKVNEKTAKKIERWQKICESAAKQSGRGIIPKIREPLYFNEAVKLMESLDESYVAYEKELDNDSSMFTNKNIESAGIFIGAEGGFSLSEIEECISRKIMPISLGKRILRTETASITALSILLYVKGGL